MNYQIESDRILALFPILNHRLKMKNRYWAIRHVKEAKEMLKNGVTIEDYEQILKILENEKH